jgi:hypothetical protein
MNALIYPRIRYSLPRVIDKFVRAFGVVARQAAGYPPGHPAVTGSLAVACRLLSQLANSGGPIVLGIARDGLLYGDQKLTSPQALELARALYESDVALLRLESAAETSDLHSFFRCMRSEARRAGGRLADELTASGARHIHVEEVGYSALGGDGEARAPASAGEGPGALWDRILKATLSGKRLWEAGRISARRAGSPACSRPRPARKGGKP